MSSHPGSRIPPTFLPADGLVLHIGPHKTGTNAVQSALEESRPQLLDRGIATPDPLLQYWGATSALQLRRGAMERGARADLRDWHRLRAWAVERPGQRLMISSEWFDDAGPQDIRRVVDGFGSHRVRIVVTVRALERVLPSTWQQTVKTGSQRPYEKWLAEILQAYGLPDQRPRPRRFWHRHDHASLVERWADEVGPDHVAVIIADERRPEHLLRSVEAVLGVPEGTLRPGAHRNRSLTLPEILAVQDMYREVGRDIPNRRRHKWLQRGAARYLVENREPPADEPRLTTPATAVAQARTIGRDIADRLARTGVHIVGDPADLVPTTPVGEPESGGSADRVPVDISSKLLAGLFEAASAECDRAADALNEPQSLPD